MATSVGKLAGTLSLDNSGFTSSLRAAADRTDRFTNRVDKSTAASNRFNTSSKRGTMALLELSRGAEDAASQWGTQGLSGAIRGASNNLSQAAALMGGGFGIAVSLAAAGTSVLVSQLEKQNKALGTQVALLKKRNELDRGPRALRDTETKLQRAAAKRADELERATPAARKLALAESQLKGIEEKLQNARVAEADALSKQRRAFDATTRSLKGADRKRLGGIFLQEAAFDKEFGAAAGTGAGLRKLVQAPEGVRGKLPQGTRIEQGDITRLKIARRVLGDIKGLTRFEPGQTRTTGKLSFRPGEFTRRVLQQRRARGEFDLRFGALSVAAKAETRQQQLQGKREADVARKQVQARQLEGLDVASKLPGIRREATREFFGGIGRSFMKRVIDPAITGFHKGAENSMKEEAKASEPGRRVEGLFKQAAESASPFPIQTLDDIRQGKLRRLGQRSRIASLESRLGGGIGGAGGSLTGTQDRVAIARRSAAALRQAEDPTQQEM